MNVKPVMMTVPRVTVTVNLVMMMMKKTTQVFFKRRWLVCLDWRRLLKMNQRIISKSWEPWQPVLLRSVHGHHHQPIFRWTRCVHFVKILPSWLMYPIIVLNPKKKWTKLLISSSLFVLANIIFSIKDLCWTISFQNRMWKRCSTQCTNNSRSWTRSPNCLLAKRRRLKLSPHLN